MSVYRCPACGLDFETPPECTASIVCGNASLTARPVQEVCVDAEAASPKPNVRSDAPDSLTPR